MTVAVAGSDAILERLLTLHPKSIDLTLSRLRRLLSRLGNPERKLPPVVHIAGTNGKGSTLSMIRAGLEAAGKTTHAYTSPHLSRFHERIRVAGELIEEDALAALLDECERANDGAAITFFEITTAAALLAFARREADYCLLEVGLGGRMDATNVVAEPALTVITPVSIDHQQFLGETIEEIAAEKAGILKRGAPCVVGVQEPLALAVIKRIAESRSVALRIVERDWRVEPRGDRFVYIEGAKEVELDPPGLPGRHQVDNAGVAAAALSALGAPEDAIRVAPARAEWPARIQRLSAGALARRAKAAGAELWLDGGHNPAAGQALAAHFRELEAAETHLICGMLDTKDPLGFLMPFVGVARRLHAVPVASSASSIPPFTLSNLAADAGIPSAPAADVGKALEAALGEGASRVLICGSLYLAGEVLRGGAA
ncbi:MAG: folylpolyglutamate synthase/dihydrofolate synthase family protein [Pseudomonadota bacterium]